MTSELELYSVDAITDPVQRYFIPSMHKLGFFVRTIRLRKHGMVIYPLHRLERSEHGETTSTHVPMILTSVFLVHFREHVYW